MRKTQVYSILASLLISSTVQILSTASAANLDLSSGPLFLANNVPPNILIVLDNSTSTDFEILAKAHWERAAYEYSYASGDSHKPTDKDKTEGLQLETCLYPDLDCGILREDGRITLSGPDLANAKGCTSPVNCNPTTEGNSARNYLSYEYMSSCYSRVTQAPCCSNCDDNYFKSTCTAGNANVFSLANCPRTESLDWRVRSADLNVLYYNPNVNYKPWQGLNEQGLSFQNADFTRAHSYPYKEGHEVAYNKVVNLGSQAPLGIDPTSCTLSSSGTSCTRQGFVYYVWIDDKGYGNPPATCPQMDNSRPHRGACINMTDRPNGIVDLWDSHYKVTITANTMTVEKITCSNTPPYYNQDGSLNCTSTPSSLPTSIIPARKLVGNQLTLEEEKQNIANWFQYYRRRILTIKEAISEMPTVAPNYRYGLMTMAYDQSDLIIANDSDQSYRDSLARIPSSIIQELIFEFPQANAQTQFVDFQQHNDRMLTMLFKFGFSGYTYMRETLDRAGKYYTFRNGGNTLIPGTTIDPIINACQRNYSLIITDGYYIIPNFNTTLSRIGDTDNDTFSVTLADVARYYYDRDNNNNGDIRSDFPNILNPTSCDNPNNYPNYQHMVTFGVSLGAPGLLSDTNGDGWPDDIVNPRVLCPPPPNYTNVWNQTANSAWARDPSATTCGNCPQKMDDLWHAAYNSHGAYILAQDPVKLQSALSAVLERAREERTFATAASSSSYYSTNNKIFLTSFESQYWNGDLQAFTVDAQGSLVTNPQGIPIRDWSAAEQLNNTGFATRNIYSYKPIQYQPSMQYQPIAFAWDQLNSIQQNALNGGDSKGRARVDFLRGRGARAGVNRDEEWINSNNFRIRSGVLGDIIQSDPVYVGQPIFRYDEYNCAECSSYSAFKSTPRKPMVYVGANDGMLHGFDACAPSSTSSACQGSTPGQEKMAYIPGSLIDRLASGSSVNKMVSLTSRNYAHNYYVDGSATVGDAYINGAWTSILVGTLRAGGQAVFALDINNPTNFNTNNILWEFSDYDDPDLGYTFSRPVIVRLNTGSNARWAAIFGNGYNNTEPDGSSLSNNTERNGRTVVSTTGEAVLFVCYLDTRTSPCIKVGTGAGKDPVTGRPNGLATPAVVDVDDDLLADYVYVGDLFGNLWKFDIRNSNPSSWTVVKLFQAVDSQGKPQPITVRPVVDIHPYGAAYGQIIYFGTGKYFENNDNQYEGTTRQSFYGIWDYPAAPAGSYPFSRNTAATAAGCNPLFQQEIYLNANSNYRRTGPPTGAPQSISWLDSNSAQCNKGWFIDFPFGEKQISNPTLWNNKLIFTTLVLPQNPLTCDSDGSTSWLMVVDPNNGGTLNEVTFDVNGDSRFDQADLAVMGNRNASGKKSTVGALPRPGLISNGDVLVTLACGTDGGCEPSSINDHKSMGRQSWRQLWK